MSMSIGRECVSECAHDWILIRPCILKSLPIIYCQNIPPNESKTIKFIILNYTNF
jgi:hypothetical protein